MNTDFIRAMTWLSPAFPTGAFAWSGGLEAAYDAGRVNDIRAWIADAVAFGSIRTDGVFCAGALRGEDESELALALIAAPERREEVLAQGEAFARAVAPWAVIPTDRPLSVAVGLAGRATGIDGKTLLTAYVHSMIVNMVQSAQRLGRVGQDEGMRVVAALEREALELASFALGSTLDDLGQCGFVAEIATLRHGGLASRVFRS